MTYNLKYSRLVKKKVLYVLSQNEFSFGDQFYVMVLLFARSVFFAFMLDFVFKIFIFLIKTFGIFESVDKPVPKT